MGCGSRKCSLASLEGLKTLRWGDQEAVARSFGMDPLEVLEPATKGGLQQHWADFDTLVATCKPKQIKEMVLHNAGNAVLQDYIKTLEYAHMAADGLRHGKLAACAQCGQRSLFYPGAGEVKCAGWYSPSVRCDFRCGAPERDGNKWELPADLAKKKGVKEYLEGGSLATGNVVASGDSASAPTKRKKDSLSLIHI